MKKNTYRIKRSINLYYKPDRTTKPATAALYALFALVCLAGLGKILVYDVWSETAEARRILAEAREEYEELAIRTADYDEVKEKYSRYAATDRERELVDRIGILNLLDESVASRASMDSVVISGDTVQLQFSGVTLAEAAQVVNRIEASPIVAGTVVSTAATTEDGVLLDEDHLPLDESSLVRTNVLIRLQKEVAEE